MKPFLAFDTETSGVVNWDKPASDPSQPALVQLAWVLHDERGRPVHSCSALINVFDDVPPEATAIHGYTAQDCRTWGISAAEALSQFEAVVDHVDTLVSHGMNFDRRVIEAATHRLTDPIPTLLNLRELKELHCTMGENVNVVKAPFSNPATPDGRGKGGKWKFPSLAETLAFYGLPPVTRAHDALADAQAAAAIWMKMQA